MAMPSKLGGSGGARGNRWLRWWTGCRRPSSRWVVVARVAVFDSIAGGGYAAGMRYPGGKAGSGVYQRIINQMPPHEYYVEPFLGGGAVMRLKRPARFNLGVDLDGAVLQRAANLVRAGEWISTRASSGGCGVDARAWEWVNVDAIEFLGRFDPASRALVYCDPPYLMSTRSSQRRMYRHELERPGHIALLDVLVRLPCMVMVSGYWSGLYHDRLSSWRLVQYRTMTRGGRRADECLWCNFPEPTALHDYRYLGRDFRERERIARKRARWLARLSKLPVLERAALVSALLAGSPGEGPRQDGRG